jgi:hypothetical protein
VHRPIGDITIENLAGNTGKRYCQTPYTPRTHKIYTITATGMENKDTKECTQRDGTRSPGITGCTRWNRMGQVHVWKYIHIVARNPGAVLSRNKKTELRTTLDKGNYTEDLASCMGPIGTQECDPS